MANIAAKQQDNGNHIFRPGDRAYHVVRREIVELRGFAATGGIYTTFIQTGSESVEQFTPDGRLGTTDAYPILLPLWHPDVPERCRMPKPKRKVEVVRWVNIEKENENVNLNRSVRTEMAYLCEADAKNSVSRAVGELAAIAVELRGSYGVDE